MNKTNTKSKKIEQLENRTSTLYKFICLFSILFILLLQRIAFGSFVSIFINPIMLTVVVGISFLFYKKISYKDLIFISKFSFVILLLIIITVILNFFLVENKSAIYIFYGLAIFLYGILWGFSNIQADLHIIKIKKEYHNLSLLFVFLYYFVGGILAFVLSYLAIIMQLHTKPIFLLILEIGSNLLAFGSGYLISLSLVTIVSVFKMENKKVDFEEILLAENKNVTTSSNYKIFSLISSIYLLIVLISALIQNNISSFCAIPVAICSLIYIYILNKKKYSYETTVTLNSSIVKSGVVWLIISMSFWYFVPSGEIFNFEEFINNMFFINSSGLIKYNSAFYFSYNILAFSMLGFLLSLNNTVNCYNFYVKTNNAGYSIYRMMLALLVFQLIGIYLLQESINDVTIIHLEYFLSLLLLISFISLITGRFIGFTIYRLHQ